MANEQIQQAESQVSQARQAISSGRKQFTEATSKATSLDPRVIQTREQLMKATPQSQVGVRNLEGLRAEEKAKIVKELKEQREEFEKQVRPVESEIRIAEKQIQEAKDWEKANAYLNSGYAPFFESKSVQDKWRQLKAGRRDIKQVQEEVVESVKDVETSKNVANVGKGLSFNWATGEVKIKTPSKTISIVSAGTPLTGRQFTALAFNQAPVKEILEKPDSFKIKTPSISQVKLTDIKLPSYYDTRTGMMTTSFTRSGRGTMSYRQPTQEEVSRMVKQQEKEQRIIGWFQRDIFDKQLEKRGVPLRDVSAEQKFIKKQFPLLKTFDIAAEGTVRAGEFLGGVPIPEPTREGVKGVISAGYTFTAISPLIQTAKTGTQESQYVYDAKRGVYVKKEQLQSYIDKVLRKFDAAYEKQGKIGVAKELKALTTGKDTKNIENLLKVLKDKNYISSYVVDTTTGKFSINVGDQLSAVRPTQFGTQSNKIIVDIYVDRTTDLKQVGNILATSSLFKGGISLARGGQITPVKQSNLLEVENVVTTQRERTIPITTTRTVPTTTLSTSTQTLQVPKTGIDTGTIQITTPSTTTIQDTVIKTTPKTGQDYFRTYKKPIKEIIFTPIKIPGEDKDKKKKLLELIGKKKFEIFGRRFGQDISLGTEESEKKAKIKLVKFLRTTLGASGFIKKGEERLKLRPISPEFRVGKRDSTRVVQKRKFRLGTRSEVSEILSAKKVKGGKKTKLI